MAKTVRILTKENDAEVIVDGNKISDVISYELKEDPDRGPRLTVEIAIMDEVEVRL